MKVAGLPREAEVVAVAEHRLIAAHDRRGDAEIEILRRGCSHRIGRLRTSNSTAV